MDNILSCFILSYILLPPFIYSYILHLYTTQPRIFYTTLIYSPIRLLYIPLYTISYILLYILLYILSTLLYTLTALLILPPAVLHLSSLLYSLIFSYILAPLIFIFLYSHIVIPTLLYRKGITTLPPIFTRFISLS